MLSCSFRMILANSVVITGELAVIDDTKLKFPVSNAFAKRNIHKTEKSNIYPKCKNIPG